MDAYGKLAAGGMALGIGLIANEVSYQRNLQEPAISPEYQRFSEINQISSALINYNDLNQETLTLATQLQSERDSLSSLPITQEDLAKEESYLANLVNSQNSVYRIRLLTFFFGIPFGMSIAGAIDRSRRRKK